MIKKEQEVQKMAYFPMYVDISSQSCLIVGGGIVAYRKAVVLRDFDAEMTVIAEDFCEELLQYAGHHPAHIRLLARNYEPGDCEGRHLVVAATDQSRLNHEIAVYCKKRGIPVNVVDHIDDCTFIFPAYVRQNDLVASFSSSGKSPLLTQVLREKEEDILTPLYGELNDCLGQVREHVKSLFTTEQEHKRAYRAIFEWTMEHGAAPQEAQIQEILEQL
jgi:uroporphyrin-III C-methyltransferase/precorrin-2 dehydrogenase/sirohydrochlorin ferrochelatase/precorrin-2 dehydrogenase/sirohydrochlorin ferrochelatase